MFLGKFRTGIAARMVLASVAALTLAACVTDGSANNPPDAVGADAEQPGTQEASGTGSLTYVHDRAVDNLDPDRNATGQPLPILFPIYDRLVHLTPEGELIPGLAIERNFLNDGRTLELVLREGVLFHDGTPFNAEAVAYNINRSATLEEGMPDSRNNVKPIAEVEIIDEHTVHLHRDTNSDYDIDWALLESRMSENIGMMVSPKAAEENPAFDQSPVGTGPFRVVDFTSERVQLERFEDYWDPEAVLLDELVIYMPPGEAAVLAGIRDGQFDIGTLSTTQIQEAEAAGVNVNVADSNTIFQLWTNQSRPPLDDENVRKALVHGIDRVGLVETLLDGHGDPTLQPFPSSVPAYNEICGIDQHPYDPELAAEHVAQSAYADDAEISIDLQATDDRQYQEIAQWIQANLAEVGITVNINTVESAQISQAFEGGQDMWIGRRGRLDPLEALENSWNEHSGTNPGGFTSETIQSLLDQMAVTTDADQRLTLARETSCAIVDEAFSPGLFGISRPWGISECVVGFEPPVTPYPEFKGVGIAPGCD